MPGERPEMPRDSQPFRGIRRASLGQNFGLPQPAAGLSGATHAAPHNGPRTPMPMATMTTLSRSTLARNPRAFPSGADDLADALMRSGLVAFAVVDSGNVVAASPALREVLGATSPYQHIDGDTLSSIVAETDRARVAEYCRGLLRDGVRAEIRCGLLHRDGRVVPALLSGTTIPLEGSEPIVLIVTEQSAGATPAPDGSITVIEAFDRETGFAAQALMLDRLKLALAAARRYRRRAAVLRIDLAGLDSLLASMAAPAAAEVLASVAETLRNCVRDCDTIARLGASRFVVLLPEVGRRDDGGITAARIVESIDALFTRNEPSRRASAVIGVAAFPTDGANPEQLMAAAESALRSATAYGNGGRFALADATSAELTAIEPLEFRSEDGMGIEELDDQHRALIDQANKLAAMLRSGADAYALERALRTTMELLRMHFAAEARHLSTSPYEGSVDLKSRNLRFLDELQCILLHVNTQSVTLAIRHLHEWLVPHLRTGGPKGP
jgi:diguanylate cyclase (GGDEF)-like protein/PAS domain S-box-containing protein